MPPPVTITYTRDNTPEWIAVLPEDINLDYTIQITLETYDRIRFSLTNIEGLLIDLQKAISDMGLSVADVYAIISFLRFTAPRITLIVDGTGVDTYEIILPPGLSVAQVINATTGQTVPFFTNTARNSIVFTVEFASTVEIQLLVSSIVSTLNRAVSSITTVLLLSGVLQVVISEVGKLISEVREQA